MRGETNDVILQYPFYILVDKISVNFQIIEFLDNLVNLCISLLVQSETYIHAYGYVINEDSHLDTRTKEWHAKSSFKWFMGRISYQNVFKTIDEW